MLIKDKITPQLKDSFIGEIDNTIKKPLFDKEKIDFKNGNLNRG